MDPLLQAVYEDKESLLEDWSTRITELLDWLGTFTLPGQPGVTRLLYTTEWLNAQRALQTYMDSIGLETAFDDVGNLFGRLTGEYAQSASVVTGSHIDTVAQGGKFDGAYGVVAGIVAADYLRRTYGKPNRTLEVVSLCEEEGSRFPLAYWGSGSIVGERRFADIDQVKDRDGISFLDAARACGFGAGNAPSAERQDIDAFIELHVEQGRILEQSRQSIGIVETISGQRRLRFVVSGESNHAGTTPMHMRRDALEGASAMIRWLHDSALDKGSPLVATVGSIDVSPNMPNVVAGQVAFTADIRHSEGAVLEQFCREAVAHFEAIAKQRNLLIRYEEWFREEPVRMDAGLIALSDRVCDEMGVSYRRMVSGAGHDAQKFQTRCPTALLFVPSRGGISHSPDEYTDARQLAVGALVLAQILYELCYEEVLGS